MFWKKHHFFIRNLEAHENLESFLVAAVASILFIRLFLKLTDYPQIGGATLHIAHMLWGGLLMLVAIIIMLSFLSKASQSLAAIVGGIGLGTFIDEIGKFVTQDNDYFYQPAVALMYIVFIVIIINVRAIYKKPGYSEAEFLMNALRKMEEVVLHDLDAEEKNRALSYLAQANPEAPLVKSLIRLLEGTRVVPTSHPGIFKRIKHNFRKYYHKFTQLPGFPIAIVIFFLSQLGIKLGYVIVLVFFKGLGFEQIVDVQIFSRLSDRLDNLTFIEWAELASSLFSGLFVLLGAINIYRSRLVAFKMFERSILVSIFLTQVFIFYKEQFVALLGLIFNLLILLALRYVIYKEASKIV